MAEPQTLTVPVPYEGLDTDSSPETISSRKAPFVANFLVDRPGMLPMRGPLNEAVEFQAVPAGPKVVGTWAHNDRLLIGRRALSDVAVRDPWTAPYRKAAAEADLATGVTTLKHVDLATGVVTEVAAADQSQIPGPSWTRLGDHVYGISYARAATNSVSFNGGQQWLTRIVRWDGTAALPTAYVNAPHGAQAVKAHYRRLFVLGGRNPDGSGTLQPNTLWFSDPTDTSALTDALTAWQDDTSGLVNQIKLLADDNDFGVALARVGTSLAILRRRSIWLLQGYSPSTFLVQPFSNDYGCLDPRSVVESQDGVYFMSNHGYVFFDGSQITNVSEQLRSSLLASALEVVGDNGVDGGRCVAAPLLHGYIGVSIGTSDSIAAENSITTFAGIYHTRTNAWAYVSSYALAGNFPVGFGRASTEAFIYDDGQLLDASKLTLPEAAESVDRGYDFVDTVFRWVGTPTFSGTGFTLRDGANVEAFPSGGTQYIIPSRWESSLIQIVSPMQRGQFNRVILDYSWLHAAVDQDAWNLVIYDREGNRLFDQTVLSQFATPSPTYRSLTWPPPSGDAPPGEVPRKRFVGDLYAEANDVLVVVRVPNTKPPSEASLQALHLTLQDTHTRRSDVR